jgi:hypothetical protein
VSEGKVDHVIGVDIAFRDPVSEGKVDHVIGVDTRR